MMQFIKIIAVNKILQFFLEILRVVDDRCDMMLPDELTNSSFDVAC